MVSKSGGCNNHTNNNNNDINININNKLDNWRQYFRKSNSDIFDIIEHAIMVAAYDYPKEYRDRKSSIAELLFSCKLTKCLGCNRVELNNSIDVDDHDDDDDHVDIGGDDEDVGICPMSDYGEPSSNVSYGDVEALNDLIEEEKELINEVLRIKDILYNSQDEPDSVLLDSLRRLQLMHLNVNILKETEIGKAVNQIKKHSLQEIRHLARSLIGEWKIIVDAWMETTQALPEGGTPDSINPSTIEEEEGLPSPPLDDGAFFSHQAMDFNQFFDGMDDDGNLRNSGELNKNRESGRKPSTVKPNAPKLGEEPPSKDKKKQPPLPKPNNKPLNVQPNNNRPLKPSADVKRSNDSTFQPKLEKPVVQRRPAPQPEKPRPSNEDSVKEKLEATKRKLQERYQQAENAKRQRTIQVMEIQDLPKQGLVNRNPHPKFGNRNWANGRK